VAPVRDRDSRRRSDSGDREQLAGFNHWLARLGYAVAAIDDRLRAEIHLAGAARDDTLAAMASVERRTRRRWAWTRRGAGAAGAECGRGQIASAVGYGTDDAAIRGVVSLYAPHDTFFALHLRGGGRYFEIADADAPVSGRAAGRGEGELRERERASEGARGLAADAACARDDRYARVVSAQRAA